MAEERFSADQVTDQWRLQEMVDRIELALQFNGGMDAAKVGLMRQALDKAKQQISRNEADSQHRAEEKKEADARQAMINELVARETALSKAERQEYAGFLKKEYFTKADFGALEHFYSHSWDKLTDRGKGEMSLRIFEGIRRDEFKFQELPEAVKERQAQFLQQGIQGQKTLPPELTAMLESGKEDFLQARKAGRKDEAYEILNRSAHAQDKNDDSPAKAMKSNAAEILRSAQIPHAKSAKPAHEPVVAAISNGSNKLELKDLSGVDAVAGRLKAPLSERAGGEEKSK